MSWKTKRYPWYLLSLGCLVIRFTSSTEDKHSPCNFNPRCQCSSGGKPIRPRSSNFFFFEIFVAAEYGSVICDGVIFADIPLELQDSRVFKLSLRNNNLYRLSEAKLAGSGLWSLEVSYNMMSEIPPMAFYGLERALWKLHLNNNQLTKVPSEAISLLRKLTLLNLADNSISEISRDDFRSLSNTLSKLILSGNSLSSISEAIFWDLQKLEFLDLSNNNIIQIHSLAFQNGVPLLSHLFLSSNLMAKIPFESLNHINSLKYLDMSHNRIERINDPFFQGSLQLDTLLLDYNNIESLADNAFRNFKSINYTSLEGNPLEIVYKNAFKDTLIKSLNLQNCFLSTLEEEAFSGIERSLETLDLGSNHLESLPPNLFDNFNVLKMLHVNDNLLRFYVNGTARSLQYSLYDLNLSGKTMKSVPLTEFENLRNLRALTLMSDNSHISSSTLSSFPPGLEKLSLISSGISSIADHAFSHIPSVSLIDLSYNQISSLSEFAFQEVGSSLKTLQMTKAFKMKTLPNAPFQALTGLVTLDLSNNQIQSLPLEFFHKMSHLKYLYLQDNEISFFHRGTFIFEANPELRHLDLSFNYLSNIPSESFRFPLLETLILNDNRLTTLESRSFVDMKNLQVLSLEGNALSDLPNECFQNLHALQTLNLAFNKIKTLNFQSFDSIGTMTHLSIDISHNQLAGELKNNFTEIFESLDGGPWSSSLGSSNIMSLDLSFNNISGLGSKFFSPVTNGLKSLNISHNGLKGKWNGVSILEGAKMLKILDLSYNQINNLQEESFDSCKLLQILELSHNEILELPSELLSNHYDLRFLNLGHNQLKVIPENLFQRSTLEVFIVSYNYLTEIPVPALNPVQSSLKHLDLSHNLITTISDSQLNQIHYISKLDLSFNKITTVDSRAFCCVPNLIHLNLAGNPLLRLVPDLFTGINSQLEYLNLANSSLSILPKLKLNKLKELNASANDLTFIPANNLNNLTEVRTLDLSFNKLTSLPSSAWQSMHYLKNLHLSGNPIKKVLNTSFIDLKSVEYLDISSMDINDYQTGSFFALSNMRSLKISLGSISDFNLATHLSNNFALSHLHLVFQESGKSGKTVSLTQELQDTLPLRLSKISLEGKEIENLHFSAFKFIRSKRLNLRFINCQIVKLKRELFLQLGRTQNLSLIFVNDEKDESNSSKFKEIGFLENPATSLEPAIPSSLFLENIEFGSKTSWSCSCENGGIGWMETWFRHWRRLFCSSENPSDDCLKVFRDLRLSKCGSSSILNELKYNYECKGLNGASLLSPSPVVKLLYLIPLNLLLYI